MAKKGNSGSLTASYEALPRLIKIILQLIFGYFVSAIYRIIRFLETKNILTLVIGILCFFGLGFVFWIVDLITELLGNRIVVFAA